MLQQVVPYERQGRVFGFAQSVEQAASPLTAFLIGPITQFVVHPVHDRRRRRPHDRRRGSAPAPDRGIALVFVIIGVIGLVATLLALGSRYYRDLSAAVAGGRNEPDDENGYAHRSGPARGLRRLQPPADRDNGHGRVMTKGPHARSLERRSWTT